MAMREGQAMPDKQRHRRADHRRYDGRSVWAQASCGIAAQRTRLTILPLRITSRLLEITCLATQQPVLAHDQVPIDKKAKITSKKEKITSTMAATIDKKEKIASTMAATVYSIRSNGVTFGPTLLVTCGLANTTFLRLAARFRTATTLAMLPPPSIAGTVRL
jgi:hypothetical protein